MAAAREAISSPLLDNVQIAGATGVLLNVTGGPDLTLGEVTAIADVIHDAAGDAKVGDRVRVIETRPLSKLKRWRLAEVLERAR